MPIGVSAPRLFLPDSSRSASADARQRLAREQLAIHAAKLRAYEEDERLESRPDRPAAGQRTFEHWRGETLAMGILYEAAAVAFWRRVIDGTPPGMARTEGVERSETDRGHDGSS